MEEVWGRYLVLRTQCSSDISPLLSSEHKTAIRCIHSNGLMKKADVLVQHFQSSGKHRPSSACVGMSMADGVNIGTSFVDFRVY
jgi:hypothetical protein